MVRDVPASIRFYEQLGFQLTFRDSTTLTRYAGIRRDDVELHIQWHDASEWDHPIDRPTYRFLVQDVDALYAESRFETPAAFYSGSAANMAKYGEIVWWIAQRDASGLASSLVVVPLNGSRSARTRHRLLPNTGGALR